MIGGQIHIADPLRDDLQKRVRYLFSWGGVHPGSTLIHVTHIKAGSTWVHGLFNKLFGKSVMPRFGSSNFARKLDSPRQSTQAPAKRDPARDEPCYLSMFHEMEYRPGQSVPCCFHHAKRVQHQAGVCGREALRHDSRRPTSRRNFAGNSSAAQAISSFRPDTRKTIPGLINPSQVIQTKESSDLSK
jgi:hypothetical protein